MTTQQAPAPYRPNPNPPKCAGCLGWGAIKSFQTMVVCRECGGTGRPA